MTRTCDGGNGCHPKAIGNRYDWDETIRRIGVGFGRELGGTIPRQQELSPNMGGNYRRSTRQTGYRIKVNFTRRDLTMYALQMNADAKVR
jgi:hypothetical protein